MKPEMNLKMEMKTNDVIGIGNAMMDFLVEVDYSKLTEFGLNKGQFNSTSNNAKAKDIKQEIHQNPNVKMASGGSAANTIKGIACLGGKTLFCSKVGTDTYGDAYIQELEAHGITSRINKLGPTTGYVVSFITPDAERTFLGDIGANANFSKEDVLEDDIKNSKILHLEGYQFENPAKETVMYALELAKKHQTKVSIDLSDPGVVERNKDLFKNIVENYVDIIFLNEEEAKAFTGMTRENALKEVAKTVEIVVVKLGKEGSLIYNNNNNSDDNNNNNGGNNNNNNNNNNEHDGWINKITKIPGYSANVIDTTGAGDSYAAGFLYGYCNNWDVKKAGKLGSLLAARIVEQIGVKINTLDTETIKKEIEGN